MQHPYRPDRIYQALYRPFFKQYAYFDRPFNDMVYRLDAIYPTPEHPNIGFLVMEAGTRSSFCLLMTNQLPDSKMYVDAAQFFPRYTYEPVADAAHLPIDASGEIIDGYRRVDNITDAILQHYQTAFGYQVTKDDVFYYVYGLLHSEQYRTTFAADLKRMLPRIPLAASRTDFEAFVTAGRHLADLHVNYESVEPYPLHEPTVAGIDEWQLHRVEKMRWADKTTKKAIIYNQHITLADIPTEAHRYVLGSRSALEWLIDRYRLTTDKASGIVNDPNDWSRDVGDPRYIVDLVKRVTRVSVDTVKIVDSLPQLPLA